MDTFEHYWHLTYPSLDVRNQRGAGWSEVLYLANENLFIKRQCNFFCRSFRHPWRGEPTLAREYRALQRLQVLGLNVPVVHFFGMRVSGAEHQAVLAVQGLTGWQAGECLNPLTLSLRERRQVLHGVATTIARLHRLSMQHGCLYPKHIFYRLEPCKDGEATLSATAPQVALIDLEKAKRVYHWRHAALHDLDQLARRADLGWTQIDRTRFLLMYAKGWLTPKQTRQLGRKLTSRIRRK
jgi:hypothetical protein